jgi:predicted dehydrogenase
MANTDSNEKPTTSRREFLKTTTAAAAGGTLAMHLTRIPGAYAAGSDEIRVGVIGCGGRGTGAAANVLNAAPGVKIVAMGDVFKDKVASSLENLRKQFPAEKIDVTPERTFIGFDAYEKVLASDINYVILATPPGFRPQHLKASVAAGKTIFTEKPVAVDGPGIRSVFETYEESVKKGLHIVAGTQRRHQTGYLETIQRVKDGAVGDIIAARAYWNQGGLWKNERQQGWSDLEYQMRNWLYYTWLSGDHIVEQHIHNIDVINWAKGAHPVRALGIGGRQVRTEPIYGHIYDHFTVDYEYEDGTHMLSMCRQQNNTDGNVSEAAAGTKGRVNFARYQIEGTTPWRFQSSKDNDPYVQEHTDLIEHLRAGKPINELKTVAESTLTAIMGRMSAYTGKVVTWEQALNSKENLVPQKLEWGAMAVPPVAMPGQTELA